MPRTTCPGEGWQSLGFIFEAGMDRPVGTSKRRTWVSTASRSTAPPATSAPTARPRRARRSWLPGMPANQLDLGAFTQFLTACALDERFNPWQVVQAAERGGANIIRCVDRLLLQYVARAGDARSADPGALPLPLPGPRGDARSGPFRYLQSGEGAAELAARKGAAGADRSASSISPRVAARPARSSRDAAALGRQQRQRRGTQPQRRVRHRRGADHCSTRQSLRFIADWLRSRREPAAQIPVSDRQRTGRARQASLRRDIAPTATARADAISPALGSARSSQSKKSAPTRAASTITPTTWRPSREISTPPTPRSVSRISARPTATPTCRSTASGCARRICTTARCRRVRDLLEPAENRPKIFYRGYDVIDQRRLGFVSDLAAGRRAPVLSLRDAVLGGPAECARRAEPGKPPRRECLRARQMGRQQQSRP